MALGKTEVKDIVKKHLATSMEAEGASPVPPYNPCDEF